MKVYTVIFEMSDELTIEGVFPSLEEAQRLVFKEGFTLENKGHLSHPKRYCYYSIYGYACLEDSHSSNFNSLDYDYSFGTYYIEECNLFDKSYLDTMAKQVNEFVESISKEFNVRVGVINNITRFTVVPILQIADDLIRRELIEYYLNSELCQEYDDKISYLPVFEDNIKTQEVFDYLTC